MKPEVEITSSLSPSWLFAHTQPACRDAVEPASARDTVELEQSGAVPRGKTKFQSLTNIYLVYLSFVLIRGMVMD